MRLRTEPSPGAGLCRGPRSRNWSTWRRATVRCRRLAPPAPGVTTTLLRMLTSRLDRGLYPEYLPGPPLTRVAAAQLRDDLSASTERTLPSLPCYWSALRVRPDPPRAAGRAAAAAAAPAACRSEQDTLIGNLREGHAQGFTPGRNGCASWARPSAPAVSARSRASRPTASPNTGSTRRTAGPGRSPGTAPNGLPPQPSTRSTGTCWTWAAPRPSTPPV